MIRTLRYALIIGLGAALLTPFIVTYGTTFPFVFGKALYFRILVEILLALWLALLLFDVSSRPRATPVFWGLFAVGSTALLAAIVGVDFQRSFWGDFERMGGVFNLLHVFALVPILATVLRNSRDWHYFWIFGLLTADVMAGLGLLQRFSGQEFFRISGGRIYGTLGNSIYLGQYALFFMFVSISVLVADRRKTIRALAFGSLVLSAIVLPLTGSRGALVGAFFGAAVLVAWVLLRRDLARARHPRWGFVGGGVILAAALAIFAFGFRQLASGAGGTATRLINWQIALQAFWERPLFGWGPENYIVAMNKFYRPELLRFSSYETWFDHAHNGHLDVLAMQGAIGGLAALLLYGTVIGTLLGAARRGRLAAIQCGIALALLGSYVAQLTFSFDSPTSFLLLALFYGWVIRIGWGEAPAPAFTARERAPMTKTIFAAAVGLLALLLVFRTNLPAARANYQILLAAQALEREDLEQALAARERAGRERTPYQRDVRRQFGGDVLTALGVEPATNERNRALWAKAVGDLEENIRRYPRDVSDHFHLAQLYLYGSRLDQAALGKSVEALARAHEGSLKRQSIYFALGKALLLAGKNAEAVALLREAVALDPQVRDSHWHYGLALRQAGEQEAAYRETQIALALGHEPATASGWSLLAQIASSTARAAEAEWYAARALQSAGRPEEAYAGFKNALARGYQWKHSSEVFYLSYLARDVGDYVAAYELLKTQLQPFLASLDPIELDARLAEAAYRAGDHRNAYQFANRAVASKADLRKRLAPMLIPGSVAP